MPHAFSLVTWFEWNRNAYENGENGMIECSWLGGKAFITEFKPWLLSLLLIQ